MHRRQRGRTHAMRVDECERRLAEGYIGRLAVTLPDGPMVYPMNYRYSEGSVYLRCIPGTKLEALAGGCRVAFEVDGLDEDYRSGWSVVVRGDAELVDEREARVALGIEGLRPWADATTPYWVRIRPALVTGRLVG